MFTSMLNTNKINNHIQNIWLHLSVEQRSCENLDSMKVISIEMKAIKILWNKMYNNL